MTLHLRTLGMLIAAAMIVLTGCAEQDTPDVPYEEPAPAEVPAVTANLENGKMLFIEHCGSCHGESGTVADADPEMLELLEKQPPDLTQMTTKYGGTYPEAFITKTIDGRERFNDHGTGEMPIWGEVWTQKEGEAISGQKVVDLVGYIASIQK